MYYKLGQAGVTNQGSFVLLQVRANVVTIGAASLTQIRAIFVTNWGSFYKLGQNVLQIWAGITNQSNYYKLGHNIAEPTVLENNVLKNSQNSPENICVGFQPATLLKRRFWPRCFYKNYQEHLFIKNASG